MSRVECSNFEKENFKFRSFKAIFSALAVPMHLRLARLVSGYVSRTSLVDAREAYSAGLISTWLGLDQDGRNIVVNAWLTKWLELKLKLSTANSIYLHMDWIDKWWWWWWSEAKPWRNGLATSTENNHVDDDDDDLRRCCCCCCSENYFYHNIIRTWMSLIKIPPLSLFHSFVGSLSTAAVVVVGGFSWG